MKRCRPSDPTPDLERISLEIEFKVVSPEALGILTGGVMGTPPPPTFSVDVNFPVKRTLWQWLRRKPRQWRRVHVPNARLDTGKEDFG